MHSSPRTLILKGVHLTECEITELNIDGVGDDDIVTLDIGGKSLGVPANISRQDLASELSKVRGVDPTSLRVSTSLLSSPTLPTWDSSSSESSGSKRPQSRRWRLSFEPTVPVESPPTLPLTPGTSVSSLIGAAAENARVGVSVLKPLSPRLFLHKRSMNVSYASYHHLFVISMCVRVCAFLCVQLRVSVFECVCTCVCACQESNCTVTVESWT